MRTSIPEVPVPLGARGHQVVGHMLTHEPHHGVVRAHVHHVTQPAGSGTGRDMDMHHGCSQPDASISQTSCPHQQAHLLWWCSWDRVVTSLSGVLTVIAMTLSTTTERGNPRTQLLPPTRRCPGHVHDPVCSWDCYLLWNSRIPVPVVVLY